MSDQGNLGEQALSKAAEIGISSQLDAVEAVEVDIRANPLDLIQGKVDSVSIEGKGMVMQDDLRMEEMTIETGTIALNPLSVAFGKIELTQPTDASAHVVLTEADLNRAFNSEFIQEKLQNLDVTVEGQPMTVDTEQIQFGLPGDNKFALSADVALRQTGEHKRVAFTAIPEIAAGGQRVALTQVEYTEGQGLSPELTEALLEKSSELLDLQNFELDGMSLRLQRLDVQPGKLTLEADALIEKFVS